MTPDHPTPAPNHRASTTIASSSISHESQNDGTLRPSLPSQHVPSLTPGVIYDVKWGACSGAVGDEMIGWHRAPILSDAEWSELLHSAALAPITGAENKTNHLKKILFRSVPIRDGVSGQTKDGLILTAQLDTFPTNNLSRMLESGFAKHTSFSIENDLLQAIRTSARALFVQPPAPARQGYRIGSSDIAPGDVVMLREYTPSGFDPGDPTRNVDAIDPWVVVSSDTYLELLAKSAEHTRKLGGLVRGVVAVVPLVAGPAPSGEVVAEAKVSQPGLPTGGHARFHRLRTRSIRRIASVEGPADDAFVREIAAGLAEFLGLGC